MSDIIKLNIRSKGIKAVISDDFKIAEGFRELPEVLEKEKQVQIHKQELEKEFLRGYELGKEEMKKELEKQHSQELLNQSKDFYNIISVSYTHLTLPTTPYV
jgi:hypothetical protein